MINPQQSIVDHFCGFVTLFSETDRFTDFRTEVTQKQGWDNSTLLSKNLGRLYLITSTYRPYRYLDIPMV